VKIAYLVNIYPKTSHSFIRREILALESLGIPVYRFTLRVRESEIVDKIDRQELAKTRIILQSGALTLLGFLLKSVLFSPVHFLRALRLTCQVGKRSERGLLLNLIYLVEACSLKHWLAADKIDHLHVHFGTNSTTVAMLCEVLGGPGYSFTVHGPEEFDKVVAIALPEKIKRARFVVAISSYGRSQLYRWCDYQQWTKIHIIHCGLDQSLLETPPTPLPESPNLVCVGRLSEQKGQVLLLQAVAILIQQGIDLRLTLVGDGDLRPAIETAIAELKLQDYVEITGWATEQEVKAQINAAKAMILPSFAEGLPVVLMESLALGRPVISTYIAGIPELIKPGVSGWLVPAGDIDALVEALQFLLQTPLPILTQMGNDGREIVLRQHDVSKEAKILADLFVKYAQG
jgi:glycosyltransferase involved in cell wall biosynthesis